MALKKNVVRTLHDLSFNDANKKVIGAEKDAIPKLIELSDSSDPDVALDAVKILLNLAKIDANKQTIAAEKDFLKILDAMIIVRQMNKEEGREVFSQLKMLEVLLPLKVLLVTH